MDWAQHPYGTYALCSLSAIESIFFPIPVDPILVAMGASRPKRALYYAFLTSLFSVLGALGGYYLGAAFWEVSQDLFFRFVFNKESFELVLAQFQENAFLAIFLAGFTPIPFKVFTIAAGVASLPLLPFIAGATIGRSLRFFLIGGLLFFFGPTIKDYIDRYFEKLTLFLGVAVIIGFIVYKVLF
jgi:membrane protein YqaA with SNARE-associated domain